MESRDHIGNNQNDNLQKVDTKEQIHGSNILDEIIGLVTNILDLTWEHLFLVFL
jgi:hypothetical protein